MQVRPISVEQYREQAIRLRQEADSIQELEIRNDLRDLARKYDALANSVERMFGCFEARSRAVRLTRSSPR